MAEIDDLALECRAGLPDALREVTEEMPRLTWPQHPDFDGLARFWMSRHMMFRDLTATLEADLQARLDGWLAPETLAARVARRGGALVGGLHEHHMVEDSHYFPVLRELDRRLSRGFDLLEADHVALDLWLARVTDAANAVLQGEARDPAAALLIALQDFAPLLNRHLVDEEDLIVPVLLRTGLR